jgi:hypothetical protein
MFTCVKIRCQERYDLREKEDERERKRERTGEARYGKADLRECHSQGKGRIIYVRRFG